MLKLISLLGFMMACATPVLAKSAYREVVAPDTVQRDFKGAVKSVHEKTYKVAENGARVLQEEVTIRFDPEGYQLEEITVVVTEPARTEERRFYDETGNYVRRETSKGSGATDIRFFETDPAKNLVRGTIRTSPSRTVVVSEMTYGAFHKESEGREFDAKGRLAKINRVTRDGRGLESEVLFMNAKGRVEYRSVSTWDDHGIMIGEFNESKTDKWSSTEKIEPVAADQAGNWTEVRKTGKFTDKGSDYPSDPKVVTRVIEYYQ